MVALALCLGAMTTQGICDENTKQIIVEAQKIKNSDQPFNIKIQTVDDKKTYKVGEEVAFLFTADKDCYLYLIDIGTSGKAHVLFPNKFQEDNKVVKGKMYMVPGKAGKVVFRVNGPEGTNYLKAIATLAPVKSIKEGTPGERGPFPELTDPAGTFKDISVELSKEKDWAEAELSIKVEK